MPFLAPPHRGVISRLFTITCHHQRDDRLAWLRWLLAHRPSSFHPHVRTSPPVHDCLGGSASVGVHCAISAHPTQHNFWLWELDASRAPPCTRAWMFMQLMGRFHARMPCAVGSRARLGPLPAHVKLFNCRKIFMHALGIRPG